jgi:1-acyl-sn-glycerol-3-phosphate acyltransferase
VRTGQDGKWRLAWLLIRFDSRFIAHLANAHGSMKIMLKDSLGKIPFVGW